MFRAGIPLLVAGLTIPAPASSSGLGTPGVSLPLHDLEIHCVDPRFPVLAGPWIAWCSSSGDVDRVQSIETGETYELPLSHRSPGIGDSRIYVPGREGGLIILDADGPRLMEGVTRIHSRLTAPSDVSQDWIAVLEEDTVQAFPATERSRTTFSAHPSGWYPPAVSPPFVAWVEDGGELGEELLWVDTLHEHEAQILSGGPGNQRHVVSSGPYLAWVEPSTLVIMDTRDQIRQRLPVDTGFSAPPTLWRDVACWETRDGLDVDIACSDGLTISGPGHQQWPSRWAEWLIFREKDTLFIHRMESESHMLELRP